MNNNIIANPDKSQAIIMNNGSENISPYSVQMRENTDQEKLRIRALFTQW